MSQPAVQVFDVPVVLEPADVYDMTDAVQDTMLLMPPTYKNMRIAVDFGAELWNVLQAQIRAGKTLTARLIINGEDLEPEIVLTEVVRVYKEHGMIVLDDLLY